MQVIKSNEDILVNDEAQLIIAIDAYLVSLSNQIEAKSNLFTVDQFSKLKISTSKSRFGSMKVNALLILAGQGRNL